MRNLDIVDYVINSELEKIASVVDQCSDKTKTAYVPSYEEELQRAPKDFALILHDSKGEDLRKFAMYNSELTELNMAFLVTNMTTLPEEIVKTAATNLTCAAKRFKLDVPEDLQKYASTKYTTRIVNTDEIDEKAFHEKTAKAKCKPESTKHALHGKYPINNKKEIEKAAAWFERNVNRLSIDEIDEFVTNLKSTNEPMEGTISKYASLDKNEFNPDFFNHVNIRKAQLRDNDEEGTELYNDLLRRADEIGTEKVAYVLEVIDKELGLDEYYGTNIVNPFEATYGSVKTASVKVGNKVITAAMIKSANVEDLSILLGNDVTKEIRGPEGLVIFESLPTPIKLELAKML